MRSVRLGDPSEGLLLENGTTVLSAPLLVGVWSSDWNLCRTLLCNIFKCHHDHRIDYSLRQPPLPSIIPRDVRHDIVSVERVHYDSQLFRAPLPLHDLRGHL